MKIYLEFAEQPWLRSGDMRPTSEVEALQGFRSVYGFSEEDAKIIRDSNCSRDFKRFAQFSDCLFLDLDDGEASVDGVVAFLKAEGIGFSLYKSGSKGYHTHIPSEPKFGYNVAYSQKVLIESLGIPADLSLYRPGSLFRLPGTVHRKTSQPKELIQKFDGALLDYDLVGEPTPKPAEFTLGDDSDLETTLLSLITYIGHPPRNGNRHLTIWSHAERLRRQGLSQGTVLDLLERVNLSWENQAKPESEVRRAVNQAFLRDETPTEEFSSSTPARTLPEFVLWTEREKFLESVQLPGDLVIGLKGSKILSKS